MHLHYTVFMHLNLLNGQDYQAKKLIPVPDNPLLTKLINNSDRFILNFDHSARKLNPLLTRIRIYFCFRFEQFVFQVVIY
jgi:hypothetical protein